MPASQHADVLLSIDDVADRLGCSWRTVRRYIAAGQLTSFRVGGRMIRIPESQVDALLRPIPTAGGAA